MSSENPFKYFISGGFGGVCTVIAGHPLDTIKVIYEYFFYYNVKYALFNFIFVVMKSKILFWIIILVSLSHNNL